MEDRSPECPLSDTVDELSNKDRVVAAERKSVSK